jgi:hypothetical protein
LLCNYAAAGRGGLVKLLRVESVFLILRRGIFEKFGKFVDNFFLVVRIWLFGNALSQGVAEEG